MGATAWAAAIVLILLWPAQASAQAKLTGAEIRKLVAGRSATWVRGDGQYSGTITYHRNGTITSQTKVMGAPLSLKGTWEVKGDRFCRTISLDPVPTRCQTVVPVSAGTYRFLNEDGSVATITSFR
jgi:hypothetical protein